MLKIQKSNQGFTLIEILVVMSILLLMIGIMTGALNPIALINKSRDARRKKDINRIKVAMEEYVADEGCFPVDPLLADLNSESNCGTGVFSPWINSWFCDPNGSPYYLFVEDVDCPSWFKVIVYLENEKDRNIPDWWYDNAPGSYYVGDGSLSNSDVNFGVSSTNVLWHERTFIAYCLEGGEEGGGNTVACYEQEKGVVGCNDCGDSCEVSDEHDCFLDSNCDLRCQVSCCTKGQSCD